MWRARSFLPADGYGAASRDKRLVSRRHWAGGNAMASLLYALISHPA
jgi:hypothetical protein